MIEQSRLERSPATGQALPQQLRRELRRQRLGADARVQILLERVRREQVPGAEAAHVAVGELAAVVELEPGSLVRDLLGTRAPVPERAGHTQMDDECEPALQANEQVFATTIEHLDPLAAQPGRELIRWDRPGQPRVVYLDTDDLPAGEQRLEPAADRLDLGELGHPSSLVAAGHETHNRAQNGVTKGLPGRLRPGDRPPSQAFTVAPTSAGSPSWMRPEAFVPST